MARDYRKDKPTLVFVPHYIGSFKYFEKLAPFLEEKYEVVFFLSFVHQKFFKEMKELALKDGKRVFAPTAPVWIPLFDSLPYVRYIRGILRYKKDVLHLLASGRVKKIIGVNDSGPYSRFLLEEARKRKIETFVLQWAMSFEGARVRPKKVGKLGRRGLYRVGKPLYAKGKRFFVRKILGTGFAPTKDLIGRGNAEKFGVINEETKKFFISQGVREEKLSVVGYLDFYFAEKVKGDFDADTERAAAAAARLGIDRHKKQIVFFSSPYNGKDLKFVDDKGQFEFTEKVVQEIRAVCPQEEYDILLKMHPSEDAQFYKNLEQYGVKLFDKHTNNYELIYFADLYIAGGTATNFVPMLMKKDVLFINFLNIPVVESTKNVFHIKNFVHDYDHFRTLLLQYKKHELPKQYEQVESMITTHSLEKILAWIG